MVTYKRSALGLSDHASLLLQTNSACMNYSNHYESLSRQTIQAKSKGEVFIELKSLSKLPVFVFFFQYSSICLICRRFMHTIQRRLAPTGHPCCLVVVEPGALLLAVALLVQTI
jgi:hypothetical protein